MENETTKMESDKSDLSSALDNIKKGTRFYMKESFKKNFLLYGAGCLLLILFTVALFFVLRDPGVFFLIILACFYLYVHFFQKARHIFMQRVADKLEYSYFPYGSLEDVQGGLFQIGHSQRIEDVVSGKYQDMPIKIFNYYFTIGHGKNQRNYQYTVFEIEFNAVLPDMVLLRNSFFSFLNNIDIGPLTRGKEYLSLEGDFDKYFHLYVPQDFEIEALQIFTPDIMVDFIDKFQSLNLEICGNKMYIFYERIIEKKDEFLAAYDVISRFSKKLAEVLADVGEHLPDNNYLGK